jgi:hypothetical protein
LVGGEIAIRERFVVVIFNVDASLHTVEIEAHRRMLVLQTLPSVLEGSDTAAVVRGHSFEFVECIFHIIPGNRESFNE